MDNQRFDEYVKFIQENPLIDEDSLSVSLKDRIQQREQLLNKVDEIMVLVDALYDAADESFSAPIGELENRLKLRRQAFSGKNQHSELNWFWYRYCNLEFKMLIDAGYSVKDAKAEILDDPDFIRNYKRLTGRKNAPSQRMIDQRLQIKHIDKALDVA